MPHLRTPMMIAWGRCRFVLGKWTLAPGTGPPGEADMNEEADGEGDSPGTEVSNDGSRSIVLEDSRRSCSRVRGSPPLLLPLEEVAAAARKLYTALS